MGPVFTLLTTGQHDFKQPVLMLTFDSGPVASLLKGQGRNPQDTDTGNDSKAPDTIIMINNSSVH